MTPIDSIDNNKDNNSASNSDSWLPPMLDTPKNDAGDIDDILGDLPERPPALNLYRFDYEQNERLWKEYVASIPPVPAGERLRMRFEKSGTAIYMSHLDLMRTMQRAFIRAELPLTHSEGFNPHPQISIAMPLSVGVASVCELMDFRLTIDMRTRDIPARLNAVLPSGLRVAWAYQAVRKTSEIRWLTVYARFFYSDGANRALVDELEQFFSAESIVIKKRTKRGERDFDIAPGIQIANFALKDDMAILLGMFSAQEPTVSTEHLLEALRQHAPHLVPMHTQVSRIKTLNERFRMFR